LILISNNNNNKIIIVIAHSRIYLIVEFSDGIQLLPRKWVGRVNGELKCKYPNHIEKEKKMKLAVRHMIDPQSTWDIVDVIIILGSSGL